MDSTGSSKVHMRRSFWLRKKDTTNQEGLDLTIIRGYGGGDTTRRLLIGGMMFGYSDASPIIAARSKGGDVRILSVCMARSPLTLYSLKKTGIRTPRDLKGKRIAGSKASVLRVAFPAFAKINGLDPNDVIWMSTSPAAMGPLLLAGKIDLITAFVTDGIVHKAKAKEQGLELSEMKYADWGLNLYSTTIFTRDKTIAEKRDVVGRFIRASMKGFSAALEDPKAAVDALIRKAPALSPDLALKQHKIANELLLSEEAYKEGLGTASRAKVSLMIDVYTQYMELPRKISPDEVFTNEFLPKIVPKKGG